MNAVVPVPSRYADDAYAHHMGDTDIALPNDAVILIPIAQLHRLVKLAMSDPSRRKTKHVVDVPVAWLVGDRVGY